MSSSSESVKVRVSADDRELLERAAAIEGRTLSGFIRHTAVTRATYVIQADESTRPRRAAPRPR